MPPSKKQPVRKGEIPLGEGDAEDFMQLTEPQRKMLDLRFAISHAIRDLRKKRKLSQARAAEIVGTSQPRYSNIELALGGVSLDLTVNTLFALGGELPRETRKRRRDPIKKDAPEATSKTKTVPHSKMWN